METLENHDSKYLFSSMQLEYFKKAIEDMSAKGLRCVAFAYKPCAQETLPTDEDDVANWALPDDDLVLLAIVGLKVCECPCHQRDLLFLCFYFLMHGFGFCNVGSMSARCQRCCPTVHTGWREGTNGDW